MTIEYYSPERFEECALRLLDIAAEMHKLAKELRQNGVQSVPLNDKKAVYLLDGLEAWSVMSKSKTEILIRRIGKTGKD